MRLRTLGTPLALAAALAGCGSHGSTSTTSASGHQPTPASSTSTTPAALQNATLVLDFTPNAIHAGIYTAIARGYDRAEHVALRVIAPSASTDSVKLLETGRADFAILDIHDLAIADERGADLVGIMAIVERPLAAVIAAPSISHPSELQDHLVGVTGDPSDEAVLRSIVAGAGGDPAKVKTITIGFNAVAALLSGRVSGATAFWNDEGLTIQQDRPGFHVFRLESYGAPAYPELVLCASAASLKRDPQLAHSVVDALVRGYQQTLADPSASAAELEAQVPGLDHREVAAQLAGETAAFRGPDGKVGELDPSTLKAWARWEARFGLVGRPPDIAQMFDPSYVAGAP